MAKKPTLLERIQSADIVQWLDHQAGRTQTSLDDILNPSRAYLAKHSDEDLAELIAAKPDTREAEIARSLMRVREAWRTPAKWSMIIAIASFVIATGAFVRTL